MEQWAWSVEHRGKGLQSQEPLGGKAAGISMGLGKGTATSEITT